MPVLTPEGPGAAAIETLWWWLFWMTIIPATFVIGLCLYAVHRGRRRSRVSDAPASRDVAIILWLGAAMPLAVLIVLLIQSFRTGQATNEPPEPPAVTIEIVGHKFWWEIRYPDHGIVTANEIHIPVGQVVRTVLWSADVIHSFWVPALHGKIDNLPGRVNEFWLRADRAGEHLGFCAEFCGTQHALMRVLVIAQPPDEFAAWIDERRRPAVIPEDPVAARGQGVFTQGACHVCHSVRGVFEPPPDGPAGPDLTHFGQRRTLGSAIMPNTPENLARWIHDPHLHKPGVRMPASPMDPADLEALVTYLQSLR
jgi:cytochrome c oxidase subunit II